MGTLGKHWNLSEEQKLKQKGKRVMLEIEKEILREVNLGIKNPNWRGDEVGYSGAHKWVVKMKGKAKECSDCGKVGEKVRGVWNIQWSNCNHKYRRNVEDYTGRCTKCHQKYDIENNNWKRNGIEK